MSSILKVDQIQNAAGTTGLTIDSNGVVSNSVVPAWRVSLSSDDLRTATTNATVPFDVTNSSANRCFLSGGITVSGGVVTVPVGGIYQINANLRVDAVGSGYALIRIVINGNNDFSSEVYMIDGAMPTNYRTISGSEVYSLEAGDTVEILAQTLTDTAWDIHEASSFSGAMIG